MRLILIAFTALLFAACTKPDNELIQGEWQFNKVSKGKDVLVSSDAKEQKKIIDKAFNESAPYLQMMNMTEADFRKKMKGDIELMLKVTFKFDKSNVTVANNNPKQPNSNKSKYKINTEKKEITIIEGANQIVYKYELNDEALVLTDPKENGKLEFKRKA
jgi:hypothetical protein